MIRTVRVHQRARGLGGSRGRRARARSLRRAARGQCLVRRLLRRLRASRQGRRLGSAHAGRAARPPQERRGLPPTRRTATSTPSRSGAARCRRTTPATSRSVAFSAWSQGPTTGSRGRNRRDLGKCRSFPRNVLFIRCRARYRPAPFACGTGSGPYPAEVQGLGRKTSKPYDEDPRTLYEDSRPGAADRRCRRRSACKRPTGDDGGGLPRSETLYVAGRQWGEPSSFNPLEQLTAGRSTAMNLMYETVLLYNPLTGKM